MPVPRYSQIKRGAPVSIVLKADQRSGRQVQGTVADILTRGDHPRGIKVRLSDGRIGRVQQLSSSSIGSVTSQRTYQAPAQRAYRMSDSHNPWQEEESHGSPRQPTQSNNPYASITSYPPNPNTQQQPQSQQQYPPQPPQQHQQQQQQQYEPPSYAPPRRENTTSEPLLPQGQERSEQLETMQSYEANAPQSTDDANQATLQREFPDIDSSLIAALYGDNKNMGEVRETLQELSQG